MGTRSVGLFGAAVLVACGTVNNPAVDGGGSGSGSDADVPPDPATTVQVSPAGNDTNDGHAAPVRTLKHALGIAAADATITRIQLAGGRYDAAGGETFPYTISSDLLLAGPAGGGAILAGNGAAPGVSMQKGKLQNVELEQFSVAVTATGAVALAGVRVRDSGIALRGEAGSALTVAALDLTGAAGACAIGIELNGDASISASDLAARQLGTIAAVKNASTTTLGKLTITGDAACKTPMFPISTTGAFALTESIVDGGSRGIDFSGAATPTTATLTNTIIRNLASQALTGRTVKLTMTGGELTHNGRAGLEASGGSWSFDGVTIQQNTVMGIYLQGNNVAAGVLKMRNSTVSSNGDGIYLFDNAEADLGKIGDLGNNTLINNTGQALDIDGLQGGVVITAVGNTWRPTTQGTDANGKYVRTGTIVGPVDDGSAMNFSINTGWSLTR